MLKKHAASVCVDMGMRACQRLVTAINVKVAILKDT